MAAKEYDVVVIGAGIVGASAAYHLAWLGQRVALLDRAEVASGASGFNAGSIHARGWGSSPGLEELLCMGSLEIFRSLQIDAGYDIEFRQDGYLQMAQTEEQAEAAMERAWRLRSQGYQVEFLSAAQVRALEPEASPRLLGALYYPLHASADPVKATRAMARAAVEAGAALLARWPVTDIAALGDGSFRIETPQGTLEAGRLVIAAGAWSAEVGRMLGLRIPIVPVRGQMWATAPLPPAVFHFIASMESSLHWERDPGVDGEEPPHLTHRGGRRVTRHLYGRQARDGRVVFGGDRQAVGFDDRPAPGGIEANRAHAIEVLPFLRDAPVAETWAGLMPFTLDGRPLIGPLPHIAGAYIAGGLASSGFGRGPMAGRLVAELVHGGHGHPALAEADPAQAVAPL